MTDTAPVRMGVVGLGNMGKHHVRVLAELASVDLVSVADPSEEARATVERSRPVRTYAGFAEMFAAEDLEAVVVAVPTSHHEEVALAGMDAGLHVLIEKPLAPTVEAAERIVARSEATGRIATVGHIERYNPAVTALKRGLIAGELGRVFQLRAIRTGPLPQRIQDVGVVVDLATHDLDVIRFLVDQPVESVFAECAQRMHSKQEDLSTSLIRFGDGTIALLDVNWLTPVKIRELTVVGEGGMYKLDYLAQNLAFFENAHIGYSQEFLGRQGVSEGNMVQYRIDRAEPLKVEHETFAAAIRGSGNGLVPLSDGVAAVALAEAMLESARIHRAIRDGALAPVLSRAADLVVHD